MRRYLAVTEVEIVFGTAVAVSGSLLSLNDLSDLSDISTARDNMGLKGAAILEASTGPTDVDISHLAKIGDHGIGNTSGIDLGAIDFDTFDFQTVGNGKYTATSSSTNGPLNTASYIEVDISNSNNWLIKFKARTNADKSIYTRRYAGGVWEDWVKSLDEDNTGTAVDFDVQTSLTDTTADRVVKTGGGGLLGDALQVTDFGDLSSLGAPDLFNCFIYCSTSTARSTYDECLPWQDRGDRVQRGYNSYGFRFLLTVESNIKRGLQAESLTLTAG